MDLSLRVYLRGWRSLYLHDVCCPNELPSTLSAYKTQQFRWLSGPMQVRRGRRGCPGGVGVPEGLGYWGFWGVGAQPLKATVRGVRGRSRAGEQVFSCGAAGLGSGAAHAERAALP